MVAGSEGDWDEVRGERAVDGRQGYGDVSMISERCKCRGTGSRSMKIFNNAEHNLGVEINTTIGLRWPILTLAFLS